MFKRFRDTKYLISDTGEVYSEISNKILKLQKSNNGYLRVDLQTAVYPVHRLVAEVFIENPEGKPYVNHKDACKANNHVENLEWVTAKENSEHAVTLGLYNKGEQVNTARLTEELAYLAAELLLAGWSTAAVAKEFGVTHSTITKLRKRQTWKHLDIYLKDVNVRKSTNVKKLTDVDIPVIRALFADGLTNAEIAKKYDVAPATIRHIRIGKTWINS
jgi:transposase